jgi:hypothetical protein
MSTTCSLEYRSSILLHNIGVYLQVNTALQPRHFPTEILYAVLFSQPWLHINRITAAQTSLS